MLVLGPLSGTQTSLESRATKQKQQNVVSPNKAVKTVSQSTRVLEIEQQVLAARGKDLPTSLEWNDLLPIQILSIQGPQLPSNRRALHG